ncbi:MAG: hypothetical protein WKF75_15770, partial [Singulisphaera sp.]
MSCPGAEAAPLLRPVPPRDLEAVCLKCLEKSPDRRYAGAGDLADDLRRFLDGRPTLARPAGILRRGWKWARRRPIHATLAGSVVLAAAGLIAVSLAYQARLRDSNATLRRAVERERLASGEARILSARAEDGERRARRLLYAGQVEQAQEEWTAGRVERAQDMLQGASESLGEGDPPGWEWSYLRGLCDRAVTLLPGHDAPVMCLDTSADGRTLASGDDRGVVRLWDADTGTGRAVLR